MKIRSAKKLLTAILMCIFAAGCEETDALKKMKQQTERQALAVRDLALDNQKLSEQIKKQAAELETLKKSLAAEKSAVDALKKEKEAGEQQIQTLRARAAELEKENARLSRLLQEALENYNKLAKELKPPAPTPTPPTSK